MTLSCNKDITGDQHTGAVGSAHVRNFKDRRVNIIYKVLANINKMLEN